MQKEVLLLVSNAFEWVSGFRLGKENPKPKAENPKPKTRLSMPFLGHITPDGKPAPAAEFLVK
jgi:hypothetical protein